MAQSLDDVPQAILSPITDIHLNSPLPTPRSPAGSFVSRESYSTAISSSPELENIPTAKPTPTPSLSPQSLRKSISVDSFVHYGRDSLSTVVTRPNRGHTGSALEAPSGLVGLQGLRRDLNHVNQSGRSRGDSIGSVKSSQAGDSDAEPSDAYNIPTDRYRHDSLKADQPRSFVSGGELPLPSRTPTLSTTSSMSSIMSTTTSSSTQEAEPGLRSASSLHAAPRPSVAQGRTRSGSLGVYTQNTRRIHINTQLSTVSTCFYFFCLTLSCTAGPQPSYYNCCCGDGRLWKICCHPKRFKKQQPIGTKWSSTRGSPIYTSYGSFNPFHDVL